MPNWIESRLKEPSTWKGLLAVGAAVVMYFTPDRIDNIIELLLMSGGIPLILMREEDSDNE